MIQKHPLKCIVDSDSKILILGSFPSIISRQNNFYYANPNNRFWLVLSKVYDEVIEDRILFLHHHHLALWDVIASCELKGSSDASIKNVICNDIEKLVKNYPIHTIILNGKKAATYYRKYFNHLSIRVIECPSSSSANASKKLNDLVEEYKIMKDITDETN